MKKLQYDVEHAEVAAQAAHGKALYFTARRKEFKLRAADARFRLQKVASALIASLTVGIVTMLNCPYQSALPRQGYHSDGLRLSEGRPNGGTHPSRRQHSAVENGPRPTGSARLLVSLITCVNVSIHNARCPRESTRKQKRLPKNFRTWGLANSVPYADCVTNSSWLGS